MYQNKAILIGFLGGDAEVRTGKNNQKFTTLSLATKTSYKDKESGEYISHTEWHRQEAGTALFLKCVSQFHSSLARSLLRGLCDALRQARSSASAAQPYGLRFPSAMDPP